MEIKDFKMKVTPEESRKVQEKLFDNGYYFKVPIPYHNVVEEFSYDHCLYLHKGNIYHSDIIYFNEPFDMDKCDQPELTFKEFFELYDVIKQRKKKLKILHEKNN